MIGAGAVEYHGGHRGRVLRGGDELFPAMSQALAIARHEVWLATYIFNDDAASRRVAEDLIACAERGIAVHVLVDGFGSKATLGTLQEWLRGSGVRLEIFRPIDRWYSWLQPGQLRRLHQKLCAVDGRLAFVGGINVIDDRLDMHHGWSEQPRLDFAVELHGPVAGDVRRVVHGLWMRAHLGRGWRAELLQVARSAAPVRRTLRLLRQLRTRGTSGAGAIEAETLPPMVAALVVRDNVRQRRAIERTYVEAIMNAHTRIDLACPYFYPGRAFRRALTRAAERGVRIRLLMQGKADYRFAALAARVLYDEMLGRGMRVFEYTPAFLHAKVAVVDDDWATVGSSNIDPLSLLLNLEANAVVADAGFVAELSAHLDTAFDAANEIFAPPVRRGWRAWVSRGFVAWVANTYLRVAGITSRY